MFIGHLDILFGEISTQIVTIFFKCLFSHLFDTSFLHPRYESFVGQMYCEDLSHSTVCISLSEWYINVFMFKKCFSYSRKKQLLSSENPDCLLATFIRLIPSGTDFVCVYMEKWSAQIYFSIFFHFLSLYHNKSTLSNLHCKFFTATIL